MPHRRAARFLWRNLAVVAIIAGTIVNTYIFVQQRELVHQNRRRILENNERIHDIQRARVESCQVTYEAFRQILSPFLHPTDPERRLDIRRFNQRVDRFKKGCDAQTGVKK